MIEWLKTWTNQIVVSVIIAVIFELIIPSGKNKKYIKMVINLYVLFAIINPIISKFTNNDGVDLSDYNYEQYFINNNSILSTSSNLDSSKIIKNTAEKTIKEDIKNKLLEQGYKVTSISIDINDSDSNYGKINSIVLSVEKKENTHEDNKKIEAGNSSVQINTVEEVNINTSTNKEDKDENLRKSEIKDIKEIISEEYDVSEDKIEVN